MERFWLAIGRDKGVKPREIMGAVANEVGIEGQFIGKVNIFEHYSTVDLPEGMPKQILKHLKKVRVKGAKSRCCQGCRFALGVTPPSKSGLEIYSCT